MGEVGWGKTHQKSEIQGKLKKEKKIYKIGATRAALWYPGHETDVITSGKMIKRNPDAM
jgi:hypothetical protein